jgi:hypothetical protein
MIPLNIAHEFKIQHYRFSGVLAILDIYLGMLFLDMALFDVCMSTTAEVTFGGSPPNFDLKHTHTYPNTA